MESRNNSARLAVPAPPEPAATEHDISTPLNTHQEDANNNSLLNFIKPTEFVDLPSQGRFYSEGHPLYGQNSIEISMMTAKEEDVLTNRSLIKKGVAIDRVVSSLLVDKNINVKDLFMGDKNAIVISARASAYGPDYKTNVTCPGCGNMQTQVIDLNELLSSSQEVEIPTNVEVNEKKNFILNLPTTGICAEVKLLNGHDEARNVKNKKAETGLIEMFKRFIVSLNNVTDRNMINQFLEVMPAADSRYLRETYAEIVPNIDMSQIFECNACGYEQEMEVPLSADFFWPRS